MEKEIELENNYMVIEIPVNAVEVTITAKVYLSGGIEEVSRTMNLKEIQAAVRETDAIYIPPEAEFVLTDVGKKYLEEHAEEMRRLRDFS